MKLYVRISVIVVLVLISGWFFFHTEKIRDTPAISYVIADARQIVMACLVFEAGRDEHHEKNTVSLEDAFSTADEGFRDDVNRRIESGTIYFFPPAIPVRENRVVCIVLWHDELVIIDGTTRAERYRKKGG